MRDSASHPMRRCTLSHSLLPPLWRLAGVEVRQTDRHPEVSDRAEEGRSQSEESREEGGREWMVRK